MMEWHEYSMKKKQSDLTPKTRVLILFKLLSDRHWNKHCWNEK